MLFNYLLSQFSNHH